MDFNPQTNLSATLLPDGQAPALDISEVMARLLEDQDLPISRGLTVMEYAPESKASIAYRAFAKELISHAEQSAPAQRGTLHVLPNGGDRRVG